MFVLRFAFDKSGSRIESIDDSLSWKALNVSSVFMFSEIIIGGVEKVLTLFGGRLGSIR